ncbi:MAG: hypothetical protein J6W09_08500 [Bacteroidales bacterium]|nr:hypothetical protein [Bacteroidales bacterium]
MKRFFLFFSLVCIAIGCTVDEQPVTPVQKDEIHPLDKAYVYEAFESKETWKSFNSLEERMAACQVPEAIAQQLSTEALIEVCLDHPFAPMCFASDNGLETLESLIEQNNAFKELISRIDAADKLVSYYSSFPELSIGKLYCLELLIGSGLFPSVYSDPSASIIKKTAEEYLSRRQASRNYSVYSLSAATLLVEEILKTKSIEIKEAKEILEEIVRKSYLQTKETLITTYTAFGCYVYCLTSIPDLSPSERTYMDDYFTQQFPNATLLYPSSRSYNCHDYAWTTPLSGEVGRVDDPSPYLNDSTYFPASNYAYADVIYDSASDFSGIPTSSSNVVISKWTNGPVMQHSINDSPFGTLSNPLYYELNTGAIRGAICGEDSPICYTQYPYWYSLGDYGGAPGSYYSWEVSSLHDYPTDYSLSTPIAGGPLIYLTYNVTGEFYITCSYHAYGRIFATQSIMLEPDYLNLANNVDIPDEDN